MQVRVLAVAGLLSLAGVSGLTAQDGPRAVATVRGDGISGTIQFEEIDVQQGTRDAGLTVGLKGVRVTVDVTGLPPGPHGFHLHAVGQCEPTFGAAGGHFDPGPHGMTDPDANHPFHMGDLPNLVAAANGRATLTATTTRVTLSPGPVSLFDEDGSAVIIHGNPDQGTTGASGSGLSGGPRIACGVITRR